MTTKKTKMPNFGSDQKERVFWTQHSLEEFAGELDDLDIEIRPTRTEQIAVRLYKEDLQALQELAKQKGVGHTTLARSILEQWIGRARGKAPPSRESGTAAPRRKPTSKAF
jgi:hypothetical protein